MANLANAKKAIRVQGRKAEINKKIRVKTKRLIKETNKAVVKKDAKTAIAKQQEAVKALDKAARRFMHPNTVARLKSRMAKKVNTIAK